MSYQRFNKGGRVAKSPFSAKSVQKSLNRKIKTDFPGKSTFFESPITHKRFIFEHSYISYGKRQKSCCLIVILVILSYLTSPTFNSSSKSTGYFICRWGSNKEDWFSHTLSTPSPLDGVHWTKGWHQTWLRPLACSLFLHHGLDAS